MICPNCDYDSAFNPYFVVFSRSSPCIACGFDMDGVEFYGEATSVYVTVEQE